MPHFRSRRSIFNIEKIGTCCTVRTSCCNIALLERRAVLLGLIWFHSQATSTGIFGKKLLSYTIGWYALFGEDILVFLFIYLWFRDLCLAWFAFLRNIPHFNITKTSSLDSVKKPHVNSSIQGPKLRLLSNQRHKQHNVIINGSINRVLSVWYMVRRLAVSTDKAVYATKSVKRHVDSCTVNFVQCYAWDFSLWSKMEHWRRRF